MAEATPNVTNLFEAERVIRARWANADSEFFDYLYLAEIGEIIIVPEVYPRDGLLIWEGFKAAGLDATIEPFEGERLTLDDVPS